MSLSIHYIQPTFVYIQYMYMWQHKKPIQTCNLDTCTIRYSIGKRFKKIKLATNVLFINSMS